jgi:hypothetical protein
MIVNYKTCLELTSETFGRDMIAFSDCYSIGEEDSMILGYYLDGQLYGIATLDKKKTFGMDIRPWFDVDGDIVRISRNVGPSETFKLVDDKIMFAFDRKEKMTDLD